MHYPSAELVAVAWAKTVGGDVDPTKVATTLPADTATWSDTGFVRVVVVGGDAGRYVPLHTPVVAFECWAASLNSNKSPWNMATGLAQAVLAGTYRRSINDLAMPGGYYPARLLSIYPVGSPIRIPGDSAGFARVSVDCAIAWTTTAAVA